MQHDKLAKLVFQSAENLAGELRAVLPPGIRRRLDLSTLRHAPGSFVDKESRSMHADLLFSVRTRGGRPALLYVLFEHKSRNARWVVLDLLGYIVRIWEWWRAQNRKARRLPAIIPLVLAHDGRRWRAPRQLEELIDVEPDLGKALRDVLPRLGYVLDDLASASDRELEQRAMSALGRLGLLALKHARSSRDLLERLSRWAGLVRDTLSAEGGWEALWTIFEYIMNVSKHVEPEPLARIMREKVGEHAAEVVMSLAERLKQEGWNRGRAEGHAEGHAEGWEQRGRQLLRELIVSRFGPLSEDLLRKIDSGRPADIDRWARALITAETLGDIFETK